MPAYLMDTMYSLKEMPWHKDAFVSQYDMGAIDAMAMIEGVTYEKRPVQIFLNGQFSSTKDYAIVRSPFSKDPQEKVLGFVKGNYKILQPMDICQSFDDKVGAPVETLGFLGHGQKLFMTWHLPKIDVNGDEVKLYGFVASGYDGKFGASLYVVSVRVVCSNTFAVAVAEGETDNYGKNNAKGKVWTGRHNSSNLGRDLGIWMEHVQNRAVIKAAGIETMFNNFAKAKIEDEPTLADLLFKIYPNPKELPEDYPDLLRGEKQDAIDDGIEKAERDRKAVYNLFNGGGIAIDATGWGLFNAVTQMENHERTSKKPAEYSILFGGRANTMNKAANVIADYSKNF